MPLERVDIVAVAYVCITCRETYYDEEVAAIILDVMRQDAEGQPYTSNQ